MYYKINKKMWSQFNRYISDTVQVNYTFNMKSILDVEVKDTYQYIYISGEER